MLNMPVDVWVLDSRTMVGARFVEIHVHDILRPEDVSLLVELMRGHFMTREIHLDEAVEDIRAFFASHQYVATVERTLSDFDFTLATNMLGHMTDPQLSLRLMQNREYSDIHMWEPGALWALEYMLC
jgi:hypothetical protein